MLSGPTRFLTVPTLSESLAGRAAFVDLWPFSVAERTGAGDFIKHAFDDLPALLAQGSSPWDRDRYLDLICAGGYPEVVRLADHATRTDWFDGYLRTILQRDVRSFATVQHLGMIPRLLGLVAARAGSTSVLADFAKSLDLNQATVRNYLSYMDTVFLTAVVPAWSTNLTTRAAKGPRIFVTDPGLHAYLLGIEPAALRRAGHPALGGLVEAFTFAELTRLLAAGSGAPSLLYFKDRDGHEVDFVLERRDGSIVAIEVKAAQSVNAHDARHVMWLRDKVGEKFAAGIVLHLGEHSLPFGDRIAALPMSALWSHAEL